MAASSEWHFLDTTCFPDVGPTPVKIMATCDIETFFEIDAEKYFQGVIIVNLGDWLVTYLSVFCQLFSGNMYRLSPSSMM